MPFYYDPYERAEQEYQTHLENYPDGLVGCTCGHCREQTTNWATTTFEDRMEELATEGWRQFKYNLATIKEARDE